MQKHKIIRNKFNGKYARTVHYNTTKHYSEKLKILINREIKMFVDWKTKFC